MPQTAKLLETLVNVLFAKTPSDAVKNALKGAVDQLSPPAEQQTWEQLFLRAFQAAAEAMRPQLQRYAGPDGEVGLDMARLQAALQGDLSVHDLAESDLPGQKFQDRLANELFARDALYIGGSRLSRADTWHLVRLLVTRYAPAQFKALVERDEGAFRQALRREALQANLQLEEAVSRPGVVRGRNTRQEFFFLAGLAPMVAVRPSRRSQNRSLAAPPGFPDWP